MKKNTKLLGAVALALLSVTAPSAQTINTVDAKTVSNTDKKEPIEKINKGPQQLITRIGHTEVDMNGICIPNPIYIPKRHDKKTWAQQGRDAKKRKRKIGR